MDLPEKKKPYRFVLHEHIRGKSAHLDLRFEVNDYLIGFTLDDPGRVGDPLRFRNDAKFSSENKVLAQLKERQPTELLKVKGEIEPGAVGATKNLPVKFKILDSGMYEMGVQKPHFIELFLKGKKYDGRFMFRKLPMSEKADKSPSVWFGWKPVEQDPYILSSRAIQLNFVPPKGRSALPKEWEEKIPSELRWWEKNWEGEKAVSTIKSIRQLFLKRDILSGSKLNLFKKSQVAPKAKLKDIELTNTQKGLIMFHSKFSASLSLGDIADEVGCSKQSVVYWQRKTGLR